MFRLCEEDGKAGLVKVETKVTESVYLEQSTVTRTVHGCYPIGRCDCPDQNFKGVRFETAVIVGANALISVGIAAIPRRVYCAGEHIVVRYMLSTASGVQGIVWICKQESKPGVIIAHAMHGVVKYCDTRLEDSI